MLFTIAVEDSELTSDRTLDDDDDNEEDEFTASLQTSQRSKQDSSDCRGRQAPPPTEMERQQSDTADSELRDDDWTYPDDNSPTGSGGAHHRERRDSGVGSSLTRSSRYIRFILTFMYPVLISTLLFEKILIRSWSLPYQVMLLNNLSERERRSVLAWDSRGVKDVKNSGR